MKRHQCEPIFCLQDCQPHPHLTPQRVRMAHVPLHVEKRRNAPTFPSFMQQIPQCTNAIKGFWNVCLEGQGLPNDANFATDFRLAPAAQRGLLLPHTLVVYNTEQYKQWVHTHTLFDQNRSAKENFSHSRTDALEYRGCSQQQAIHRQTRVHAHAQAEKMSLKRATSKKGGRFEDDQSNGEQCSSADRRRDIIFWCP